jgi:hypothetical protein
MNLHSLPMQYHNNYIIIVIEDAQMHIPLLCMLQSGLSRAGSLQYFLKLLKWSGRWCSAETKPATPESATLLHRELNISRSPKMPLRNRSKSLPKVIAARPEAAGATSASCQLGVLRLWRDVKLME